MNLLKLLAQPFWRRTLLAAILFSIACLFLGLWQWSRWEVRHAQSERVQERYDAAAVPLESLSPALVPTDADSVQWNEEWLWQPVSVQGQALWDSAQLVRNRPRQGTVGFEVLVPVQINDSAILWVNWGWAAPTSDGVSSPEIDWPSDPRVQLEALLVPFEKYRDPQGLPADQVHSSEPRQLDRTGQLGPVFPAEAQLRVESAADVGLVGFERPEATGALNLSYAFQWWIFAIGGYYLWFRYAWRHRAASGRPTGPESSGAAGTGSRKARQQLSDEDIEDAIIEAQESRKP